jgi:DNA polymerase III subunit delta
MANTADSVLKDLKANKYAPLYFLQGDEPYYIDLISEYIENHTLTPTEKGFNLTVVYGKEANIVGILNVARRFPVMANRQVVIVKEAQEITDLGQEKARNMLLNYCLKPVPSTILVFCHKYKKLDGRSKLAQTIAKETVFVETKKLYDNQIPNWVTQYFQAQGFKATEKAVVMLAEFIGNDLGRIANEIDKLLINFTEKVQITEELVSKYVGISKEYNTFELQDALAKKDILKANKIVNYFAANPKSNPLIPIIALLYSYFTKVMLAHFSEDKSKQGIAKTLGINPFFADDYITASKNYNVGKLAKIIEFLHEADLQSKGVNANLEEGQILKELTFKILHT